MYVTVSINAEVTTKNGNTYRCGYDTDGRFQNLYDGDPFDVTKKFFKELKNGKDLILSIRDWFKSNFCDESEFEASDWCIGAEDSIAALSIDEIKKIEIDSSYTSGDDFESKTIYSFETDEMKKFMKNGGFDAWYESDPRDIRVIEDFPPIIVPDGTIEISDESEISFTDNTKVVSVVLPDSVKIIGVAAFSNCRMLMEINIPESVVEIGEEAFSGCRNLLSITIPNGVELIDNCAFCDCINLKDITIADTVKEIGADVFDSEQLTIHGRKGSYAEQYAKENDIPFKEI